MKSFKIATTAKVFPLQVCSRSISQLGCCRQIYSQTQPMSRNRLHLEKTLFSQKPHTLIPWLPLAGNSATPVTYFTPFWKLNWVRLLNSSIPTIFGIVPENNSALLLIIRGIESGTSAGMRGYNLTMKVGDRQWELSASMKLSTFYSRVRAFPWGVPRLITNITDEASKMDFANGNEMSQLIWQW
jgi:hypothetical protein